MNDGAARRWRRIGIVLSVSAASIGPHRARNDVPMRYFALGGSVSWVPEKPGRGPGGARA